MSPAQRLMPFLGESYPATLPALPVRPGAFPLDSFRVDALTPVHAPRSLSVCRMRRRVGSAIARNTRSREGLEEVMGRNRNSLKIDDCQYKPVIGGRHCEIHSALTSISCATSVTERPSLVTMKSSSYAPSRVLFSFATRATYSRCNMPDSRLLTLCCIVSMLAATRQTIVFEAENSTATEFQFRALFDRTCHQEPRHANGSVILADRLEIAVHHAIVARCGRVRCGRKMGKPERVQVDRRVGYVAQCKEIRRLAQDGCLSRPHRTRNDEQRFRNRSGGVCSFFAIEAAAQNYFFTIGL
jgi:hypothetical protein